MPRDIVRQRHKILDTLGFEEVCRIYLEECGTTRKLMNYLFTPYKPGVKQVSAGEFYSWLKKNDHYEAWREVVRIQGTARAEEAHELAMETTEDNARSNRVKIDTLKWLAEKLNPRDFGNKATVQHEHTIGGEWLEALHKAEATALPIPEAEYTVEEDDDEE